MLDSSALRKRMVESQLARRGVRNGHVLAAMRDVPREKFVDPGFEEFAYDDVPLPIGEGQTISQPYIVALMIEAAELGPGNRALEIGAGSGYAAAVMSRIADRIFAIERHATLGEAAKERFHRLGYDNIELRVGDGTKGWPDAAPFDVIVVSACAPAVPQSLKEQLNIGGRLVIPVGETHPQRLVKITRESATTFIEDNLCAVAFVRLVGEEGWAESGNFASASGPLAGHVSGRPLSSVSAVAAQPPAELDAPEVGKTSTKGQG